MILYMLWIIIFEIISDAHKGMAVAGALALGLSAIVGIGFALSKGLKKWSSDLVNSIDCHSISVYIPVLNLFKLKIYYWFTSQI